MTASANSSGGLLPVVQADRQLFKAVHGFEARKYLKADQRDLQLMAAHRLASTPTALTSAEDVANVVEEILFRAVIEKKVDGYTFPLSQEIAAAVASLIPRVSDEVLADAGGEFVAGPLWKEPEDDCWTAEIQIVGGHYVVATVHGSDKAEVEARQSTVIAALSAKPVTVDAGGVGGGRAALNKLSREWDVSDFVARVLSAKGHGSLPRDIAEAELYAFGEDLILTLSTPESHAAGKVVGHG